MVSLRKKASTPSAYREESDGDESMSESEGSTHPTGRNTPPTKKARQTPRKKQQKPSTATDYSDDDEVSEFRPETTISHRSSSEQSQADDAESSSVATPSAQDEPILASSSQKRKTTAAAADADAAVELQFAKNKQQSQYAVNVSMNPFQSTTESQQQQPTQQYELSGPAANELAEKVRFLMNLAVTSLTVERQTAYTGGRGRGRARKSFGLADDDEMMADNRVTFENVIDIDMNAERRYDCPLPGCTKDFKVQPSFKYHSQHHHHDLQELLTYCYLGEGRVALMEKWEKMSQLKKRQSPMQTLPSSVQELGDVVGPLAQLRHMLPLQSEEFNYRWEGMDSKFTSFFLFDLLDGSNGAPAGPKIYRKREREAMLMGATSASVIMQPQPTIRDTVAGSLGPAVELPLAVIENMPVLGPPYEEQEDQPMPADDFWPRSPLDRSVTVVARDDGTLKDYLPVPRSFQVSHVQNKQPALEYTTHPFDSHSHAEFGKRGYTLNAGGAVWATEWCPGVPRDDWQYLAVCGARDPAKHYVINQRDVDEKGCVQFWRFAPGVLQNRMPAGTVHPLPNLEMVLLHDHGCAWDMKWYPGNVFDGQAADKRLGILSLAFNDGTFAIYSIPHPSALRSLNNNQSTAETPLYFKLSAIFKVQLEEDAFTRISWSPAHPHRRVAVGTSRGGVLIWDTMEIVEAVRSQQPVDPLFNFVAHENYVRGLDWCSKDRDFIGSILVSTGYDGRVCLLDLRDFMTPQVLSRNRGFVTDVLWRPQFDGIIWTHPDNNIRYSANADLKKSAQVISHHAVVWAVDASDWHLFVASASADGTLLVTNPVRSRHRKFKNTHVTLFKTAITKNESTEESSSSSSNTPKVFGNIQFTEDVRPEDRMATTQPTEMLDADNWLCCVRWHPLASASTWLASGCRNGLVRVESAGSDGQLFAGRVIAATQTRNQTATQP